MVNIRKLTLQNFLYAILLFSFTCVESSPIYQPQPNENRVIIKAANCSQADVQAAINAASNGDIVSVPAGTCTWTSTVNIPGIKGITLQGAGVDATIIKLNHSGAGIRISAGSGVTYRVTGFTLLALQEGDFGNESTNAMISIEGTSQESNWRIDHIKFDDDPDSINPYGVGVSGHTYGLIDHCTFDGIGSAVFVQGGIADDPVFFGDISWTRPVDWGGPKAVYIEDCKFTGRIPNQEQVYDGRYGGRIVFRYNTVLDYWIEPHSGCPNGGRAVLHNEIYENSFEDTVPGGGGMWMAMRIRGGTGVIFNNTVKDPDNDRVILIDNQRSCLSCNGIWSTNPCDGSSPYDGNTPGYYGWPCMDQIGRGAKQESEPLYAWGNTLNGNPVHIEEFGLCGRETEHHLVEGRDYYNGVPKPGYTPYVYPHPLATPPFPPEKLRIVR
ncbi:MAG: hypothetical protein GWN00_28990 [Aliifodinibius sp.]|nr:hypothetical protein [Fodinibius sp.]NIV14810.1 hypothetical protein [Fodinibius sp.]NIY28689.1 hypothetical protein [Fodinibius sp.]